MWEIQKHKGVTDKVVLTIFIAFVALPCLCLAARSVAPGIFYHAWLKVRSPESLVQASRVIGECRSQWILHDSAGPSESLNAQSRYERRRLRTIASMEGLQEMIEQRLDKQMLGSARSVIVDVGRAYEEGFAGKRIIGSALHGGACGALGRRSPYRTPWDAAYR